MICGVVQRNRRRLRQQAKSKKAAMEAKRVQGLLATFFIVLAAYFII